MNRWLLAAGAVVVAASATLLLWQLWRNPTEDGGGEPERAAPARANDAGDAGARRIGPAEHPAGPAAAEADSGAGDVDMDLRDWPPGGLKNPREGRLPDDEP